MTNFLCLGLQWAVYFLVHCTSLNKNSKKDAVSAPQHLIMCLQQMFVAWMGEKSSMFHLHGLISHFVVIAKFALNLNSCLRVSSTALSIVSCFSKTALVRNIGFCPHVDFTGYTGLKKKGKSTSTARRNYFVNFAFYGILWASQAQLCHARTW